MYTILVTDEHELIATKRERIMQRSNLVNKLHFLVPLNYDDLDMSITTVTLEYVSPVSKEYHFEILKKSEELYKDFLEYVLPFNTKLTKEAGDIELQLTFTAPVMDADGKVNQYARKTSPTIIKIIKISEWSLQMPDDLLTPLDQRILMVQQMAAENLDMQASIAYNTPTGLVLDENDKLSLGIDGKPIGNSIEIVVPATPDDSDGNNDGMIEVDDSVLDTGEGEDCDCGCNDGFIDLDDIAAQEKTPESDDEDYFIDLDE